MTCAETQAHFLAAVSMARMQLIKLGTQWHVWSAEFVLWHVPDAHSQLEVCLRLSTLSLLLDNCCKGQISAIRPARQSAEPSRHPNSPDYRRRLWRKLIGGAALGGGGVGARVREHRKTR